TRSGKDDRPRAGGAGRGCVGARGRHAHGARDRDALRDADRATPDVEMEACTVSKEIAILGVGMHPWGKWGRSFIDYGVIAARAALADAGVDWRAVQFVSGAATIRNGYPGQVAGATFAQALGWQGAQVNTSYAACASGSQALAAARSKILAGECELALVIGADTTPKGFLAPAKGERPDDPDWVRFRLGVTN